ncbi:hypothetical protein AAF712_004262 [Marasmius tenuissimus]|uniref:F-box domain-containing protein n=1 Tax=Marasmius tenuissimus TaxID=585030 RepID=A0ABR3A7M9_9AGAR
MSNSVLKLDFSDLDSLPLVTRSHTPYPPIPSDHDRARILESLTCDEKILEKCREEITSLTQRLAKFEAYTSSLQERINQRRFIVSSIRRVPPEIWNQIFSMVCALHPYSLALSRNHPVVAPPMTLSQVCPLWRTIIHASPRLWSSLDVDIHQPSGGHQDIVKMFLRHSGKQPLKMRIVDSKPQIPVMVAFHPVGAMGLALFKMLISESTRIYELDADFDGRMLDLITGCSDINFPILSFFRNAVSKRPDVTSGQWFWDAIQKAPFKHAVSGYYYPPILPYSQLETLVCEPHLEATMVMECFQRFAPNNLVSLTFLDIGIPANMRTLVVPVTLPSLKHLTIKTSSGPSRDVLGGVLECLTLPSLQSLELQSDCSFGYSDAVPPPPSITWSLLGMVTRSECSLTRLSLNVPGILQTTDTPLTQVLDATPDLTCLEIRSSDLDAEDDLLNFLSKITVPRSSTCNDGTSVQKLEDLFWSFTRLVPVLRVLRLSQRCRRCISREKRPRPPAGSFTSVRPHLLAS